MVRKRKTSFRDKQKLKKRMKARKAGRKGPYGFSKRR